ncbi:CsbD family protein [Salinisphaera sp.]|uniref:CsbD family protein n=1 Tax=Salinisphaera sp. TaxID=1914330 RepID=UPI002D773023|nr:CsbD family protein [Salinisphaera sp.]HET7315385.1 CsbD family protein [Salinisphaera sp.]
MNDDKFEGQWSRMKGSVREHWGRLTDDDVEEVRGKRENLLGKIQERYGDTKESAEERLRDFERKF